ncbi:hypothetical protein JS530_10740 [Bifidobacterium sp. LC6]|uniref:Uncharacterized protein n=1 Tax=Bifidobacterium colobi TaxID=2809026 RepID=A0ABS5UXU6_9BIFI|nr:hypothetical protein [Bifidobacterium colobi]MBT1175953.1 hypothetical protein [Bifidobacterium colobi]
MKRYSELALKLIRASVMVAFACVAARHGDPSLILDAVDDSIKAAHALDNAIVNAIEIHEIDKQQPRHAKSRPF